MASRDKQKNLKAIPEIKDTVAVALHQSASSERAPEIVASGRGETAKQILEIAFALGIKVREDADLAQILSAVNEETEIPVEALTAVAEILIYLYQANTRAPSIANAPENESADEPTNSIQELADMLVSKWRKAGETDT